MTNSLKVKNTENVSQAVRSDGVEITVDLPLCISAGPCAAIAQKTFTLRDGDAKAVIIDPDGDNFQDILDAAKSCPVKAIILKDKTGKQIFP